MGIARKIGLVVLSVAIAACGTLSSTARPIHPSPGGAQYEVVATLLADPGGQLRICFFMYLTLPPQCDGPLVRGLDIRTISGYRSFGGGGGEAGPVRVVGTWDGRVLTATRSATVASNSDVSRIPDCRNGPSAALSPDPVEERIAADSSSLKARGILVLEIQPCRDGVQVAVPVADPETVAYLTETYGPLEIVSWFHPTTG